MMAERGVVVVHHAKIHRWSIKMMPILAAVFRRRKRPVATGWRMGETCVKVSGECKYLYRALDRGCYTVEFTLRAPWSRCSEVFQEGTTRSRQRQDRGRSRQVLLIGHSRLATHDFRSTCLGYRDKTDDSLNLGRASIPR